MLFTKTTPGAKRRQFRAALASGQLIRMPGAFSPLAALALQRQGFPALYISGAAVSADLGLPDIGLVTLTEFTQRGNQIARVVDLPVLMDADTGFGEPMAAARTLQAYEDAGVAALHVEDQEAPKRCGHLDNKAVVPVAEAVRRVRAMVDARRDPDFVICARSDARAVEGLPAMIDRLKAYRDAGADLLFPEAMRDEADFEAVRTAIPDTPLLANMTEFGKSRLLSAETLTSLGYNVVIYPVTFLRLAIKAVVDGAAQIDREGGQSDDLVGKMQTRKELYELIRYEDYNNFDQGLFNFKL